MTKTIEAIYADGVLRPLETLPFADQQHVRVTIELVNDQTDAERRDAMKRLLDDLDESKLRLEGPLPTRDELHERDGRV